METEQPTPAEGTIKRSKRHRTHRNHISDKARVEAVKEFGVWARACHAAYKARLAMFQLKKTKNYFSATVNSNNEFR